MSINRNTVIDTYNIPFDSQNQSTYSRKLQMGRGSALAVTSYDSSFKDFKKDKLKTEESLFKIESKRKTNGFNQDKIDERTSRMTAKLKIDK